MKKTIFFAKTFVFIIILPVLFSSCQRLSKEQAVDFIVRKYKVPGVVASGLNKNYFKNKKYVSYCSFPKVSITIGDENKIITYSDLETFLTDLKGKGIITINDFTMQDYSYNEDRTYAKILLTDEGKKYLLHEYSDRFEIDLAKLVQEKLKE